MNTVEFVKQVCAERGISIAKLERDCDFSNGYIRRLKEGKFPSDRLVRLSDYLGISVNDLIAGEFGSDVQKKGQREWYDDPETAAEAKRVLYDPDLRLLFDAAKDSRPEDIRMAADLLRRFKETNPDG